MDMTFMVSIGLTVVAKDSKGINENPDEEVERGGPDEVVKKRERKIQFASNENPLKSKNHHLTKKHPVVPITPMESNYFPFCSHFLFESFPFFA